MLFDANKYDIITEGGEGVIYNVDDNSVAKVYKPNVNIQSKYKRAKDLINTDLPIEVIKPIDVLTDRNNKFIGILMPKVDGEDFKRLSNKKFVITNNINTKDILTMLIRFYNILTILHAKNIFIGDLNDQNILFDVKSKRIYLIDVDSWSIGTEKCEVAMDTFKDPKLIDNNFNKETDIFSFCVLAWKSLTRIHPFGGITNPDMNIIDRIKNGISVIDNPNVKVPKNIKPWNNLSPSLINDFKNVFEWGDRKFGDSLLDMYNKLAFCSKDNDFYYAEFNKCPICDSSAVVAKKATSIGTENGFKIIALLNKEDIKTVYSLGVYLNKNNKIVNTRYLKEYPKISGYNYIFINNNDYIIYDKNNMIISINGESTSLKIMYNSYPIYDNDCIYYISNTFTLCKIKIIKNNLSIKSIQKCSTISYYNVFNDKYCLVNVYDKKLIVNINGYNYIENIAFNVRNCEIHYDEYSDKWLVVLEDNSGINYSMVLSKNNLVFRNDNISYNCPTYNICFKHEIIYIPIDGAIRGLNIKTLKYKDFICGVVSPDSKLIFNSNSFIIVNDDNIYKFAK